MARPLRLPTAACYCGLLLRPANGGLLLRQIGCSGHAYPDRLHEMAYRIRPKIVVPIHTASPYRLHPVGGPARVVVEYAQRYDFTGRPLPRGPAA